MEYNKNAVSKTFSLASPMCVFYQFQLNLVVHIGTIQWRKELTGHEATPETRFCLIFEKPVNNKRDEIVTII